MKPLISYFDNTLLPWLALTRLDLFWSDTLNRSLLFSPWQLLKTGLNKVTAGLSSVGSLVHWLAYAIVVVLFFIIPAPQFANDKEGLALIVMGAIGLRLIGTLLGGKETFRPCAIDMLVLAFFGINVVATAASHYLMPSVKGLAKLAVYIASYFLFVSVLQTQTKRRSLTVISSLLISGFLISLYGVYQYKIGVAPLATWEDPTVEEKTTRVFATLRNPNLLAGYLVPLIPLALSMAIMIGTSVKGWLRYSFVIPLGIAGITMLSCIFTGSRGGYIGITAGVTELALICLTSLWVAYPKLRTWLLLLLVGAPIVLAIGLHQFPSYEHRVLSMFAGREHSSNAYRMNVYASSLKMFLDNWWLGVGPGNQTFRLTYGLYMHTGFDALGTYCVPLEVAVESGVAGLAAFIAIIVALMSRAHQTFWKMRGASERWIIAGAASSLIAMMLHGLVDTVFYRPQVQLIFWLLAAIMVTVGRTDSSTSSRTDDRDLATGTSDHLPQMAVGEHDITDSKTSNQASAVSTQTEHRADAQP